MNNTPFVSNEVALLKRVIVHRPDDGIEWVTPDKALEYLYDDIVYLKKMREEHDIFTKVLRNFLGKENVIDIQDLLAEILLLPRVKADVIDAVCKFEGVAHLASELLQLSPIVLSYTLLTGLIKPTNKQIFAPAANYIFCRDIAVMINQHVLHCEANKDARCRESLLTRYIINHAAIFAKTPVLQLSSMNVFLDRLETGKKTFSIEGGDVMMIHPDHLLIGHSERTSIVAIEQLATMLFEKKIVKYVTRIDLPKERYCMHLDTLFTFIDDRVCVAFEPLVCSERMPVTQYQGSVTVKQKFDSLQAMLLTVFPNLKFIPCGGGISPHAEREQWTDGCNLFTIKAGVAITYDRNIRTVATLKEHGYQLIAAKRFLTDIKSGKLKIEEVNKTIILLPSNELSRARGGTHCLTFPIERW